MSWDVMLVDPTAEPVEVERHAEGGTYALGGTRRAELNITYNYGKAFHAVGFDLRTLDGRRAADTGEALLAAASQLGTQRDDDYWASTPGNAGFALSILLAWAEEHPTATWSVV